MGRLRVVFAVFVVSGLGFPPFAIAEDGGGIEEIVVRARKREELLVDTPVSVTAIGQEQLSVNMVTRLDDIATLAPNLNFRSTPTGHDAVVFIRGVGTPRVLNQFDPGVGIYVDGVFLSRLPGSLLDIVDVEQIEVLRGPQGTLFGKNTVGGAVLINTVKPREEFEASALVRAGRYDRIDTRLMLNVPLGLGVLEDRIFSRIAFGSSNHDGYTHNTLQDKNWNDRQSLTFLGSLRFLLTDDLTFDVAGTWGRNRSRGPGQHCEFVEDGAGGIDGLIPGLTESCAVDRPALDFESDVDGLQDVRSYGTWGTFDWDLGTPWILDHLSVKSLSSWREQITRGREDTDGSGLSAVERISLGGDTLLDGEPAEAEQISTELQVNASTWEDRVHLVAGAFGYWENTRERQGTIALADAISDGLRVEQDIRRNTDNWNWALFGQVTVDPLDWLSLTGGVRYTEEKKALKARQRNLRTDVTDFDLANKKEFDADTWMASVALHAPDDMLDVVRMDRLTGYFTFSQGFRGGGFNGIPNITADELEPFSPEFADSFEIGLKAEGFDRRFTISMSGFYMDYDDIQVTTIQNVGDLDGNGIDDVAQRTVNAASGTSQGFELESRLIPIDGLTISGNLAILDTEYDDFGKGCVPDPDGEGLNEGLECAVNDLTNQAKDRSGESFNNAPELTSRLAIQYDIPMELGSYDWLYGYITPFVEWSYTGNFHFAGPELAPTTQRGYNLLNARIAYTFNDDNTQIALWGRNLLDERYNIYVTPLATTFRLAAKQYAEPVTFGGEISYRFN